MNRVVDIEHRVAALERLQGRAVGLAAEIKALPFVDALAVRAAARERISRGTDLALPPRLRRLLNQALDVVDVSWLESAERDRLERTVFGR
jgi:hypothetical protein